MAINEAFILVAGESALLSISGGDFSQHLFQEGGATLDIMMEYLQSKGYVVCLHESLEDAKEVHLRTFGADSKVYQSLLKYEKLIDFSMPLRTGR